MTQNPKFVTTKLSWMAVAGEVYRVTGKAYSAQYVREVAIGYRSNKQLTIVLKDLGIIDAKAA